MYRTLHIAESKKQLSLFQHMHANVPYMVFVHVIYNHLSYFHKQIFLQSEIIDYIAIKKIKFLVL